MGVNNKIREFLQCPFNINNFYHLNYYDVVELSSMEWFKGETILNKEGLPLKEEVFIVKKCNSQTSAHLYHYPINPVYIWIMCPIGAKFKYDEKGNPLFDMKIHVDSIDDSSYGIWFKECTYNFLTFARELIMQFIDNYDYLNGEALLTYCESLGGVDKDYN